MIIITSNQNLIDFDKVLYTEVEANSHAETIEKGSAGFKGLVEKLEKEGYIEMASDNFSVRMSKTSYSIKFTFNYGNSFSVPIGNHTECSTVIENIINAYKDSKTHIKI